MYTYHVKSARKQISEEETIIITTIQSEYTHRLYRVHVRNKILYAAGNNAKQNMTQIQYHHTNGSIQSIIQIGTK